MKNGYRMGRNTGLLVLLCWIVYTCSYIGKLNYAANINLVIDYYGVSHADAGMVSTLFFFSYGIGQIVHGMLCKKYNLKWITFAGIAISCVCNVGITVAPTFDLLKLLWLINGFALSVLWPALIRLLSETLSYRDMARASVTMGTTTATGTFIAYGLSAAFATFTGFRAVFIVAAAVLGISAVAWLFTVDKTCRRVLAEASELPEVKAAEADPAASAGTGTVYLMIAMLAVSGIATNFIKDGLTTWVPSILKENYALGDSLSIILTLSLPVVTIFGNAFAVKLHSKLHDFVYQCMLVFAVSGAVIGAVLLSFGSASFALPLICFAAVCFLVGSNNSLITSIFPLFMKGKVNSGKIAGILNGFCYVGSTISSYTLGLIADNHGWSNVFYVLLAAALGTAALAALYVPIKAYLARGERDSNNLPLDTDKRI